MKTKEEIQNKVVEIFELVIKEQPKQLALSGAILSEFEEFMTDQPFDTVTNKRRVSGKHSIETPPGTILYSGLLGKTETFMNPHIEWGSFEVLTEFLYPEDLN